MKLAFVADAQSPNTHDFVRPLVEAGHNVHLISLHHVDHPPEGVTAHFLSRKPLLPKRLYLTRWPRLRRRIREISPDLTIAYRVTGNGLLAALGGWRPLVVVPTGTNVCGLEKRPPALRRIVRYVLRRADGILCWAPHMATAALEIRGSRGVRVSPNEWSREIPGLVHEREGRTQLLIQPRGVDTKLFARRSTPLPDENRIIQVVTSRSLKRAYNHEPMIRAMMRLSGSQPRIRFVLVGDGADGPRLRELAGNLGVLDSVDFVGSVTHEEIPGFLSVGSLYVSLIDHDGVSASMLEAMSVGLYPVVGDSEAARAWVRDGWNGSLVTDDSPEPIARLINRLCSKPALREEVVKRNWRLVEERADLTRNGRRIADWFQEVVACHRQSARGRKIA